MNICDTETIPKQDLLIILEWKISSHLFSVCNSVITEINFVFTEICNIIKFD